MGGLKFEGELIEWLWQLVGYCVIAFCVGSGEIVEGERRREKRNEGEKRRRRGEHRMTSGWSSARRNFNLQRTVHSEYC